MFKFDLLENEKLLEMYRQTEWALLKPAALVSLLIYTPWYFLIKYELVADYKRLLLFWTILVFLYGLYKYLLWLLNVNLLTDKRVVCIKYSSLTRKQITESFLNQLSNISVASTGLFSSLFDYGDVEIKIVNSTESLVLKNVRHPNKVKDHVWQLNNRPAAFKPEKITAVKSVGTKPIKAVAAQKRKVM